MEVSRVLSVKGGPVFSLAKVPSALLDAAANGKKPKVVYCGTANKDILFYNAGATELDDKVRMSVRGHVQGRWACALALGGLAGCRQQPHAPAAPESSCRVGLCRGCGRSSRHRGTASRGSAGGGGCGCG